MSVLPPAPVPPSHLALFGGQPRSHTTGGGIPFKASSALEKAGEAGFNQAGSTSGTLHRYGSQGGEGLDTGEGDGTGIFGLNLPHRRDTLESLRDIEGYGHEERDAGITMAALQSPLLQR